MITIIDNSSSKLLFKVADTSGVYFLKRAGSIIYIGKSINVFSRIFGADHAIKGFDEVEIHWLRPSELTRYEREQIKLHKPPLNVTKRKSRGIVKGFYTSLSS